MIDIHTHILPNMDDGAGTMEEAVKMAQMAYDSGVRSIFATPHSNVEELCRPGYLRRFQNVFHAFEEELDRRGILVRIFPGMEVYGTEEIPELLHNKKLISLNGSKYLLLEFGFRKDTARMEYLIEEITGEGFVPIIAHPERYPYVQQHPSMVYRWLEQGCALQVNKGSLFGSFGPGAAKTALYLLERRLAAFVASDAHGTTLRTPDLRAAYGFICSKFSEEYARVLLEENPGCILENKTLSQREGINL